MGIINTETFISEDGKERRIDTYANGIVIEYDVPDVEPTVPEPTQLDRIESMVAKSQEEIAQEARDAYTLELIEGGVIA